LVVKKKSDTVEEKNSSLLVGETYDTDNDNKSDEVEDKLYNLMRGYTSLMLADNGEEKSDSDDEESAPVQQQEISQQASPQLPLKIMEKESTSSSAPEWGSSSAAPGWGASAKASSLELE
jgi:hypothetical protein